MRQILAQTIQISAKSILKLSQTNVLHDKSFKIMWTPQRQNKNSFEMICSMQPKFNFEWRQHKKPSWDLAKQGQMFFFFQPKKFIIDCFYAQ